MAAQDTAEDARTTFAQGVALAAESKWAEAAATFEASLLREDRPATRANLVRAYAELDRPLDVARHAVAFLALPPAPHRGDARASIERDLKSASDKLSILTTETIPAGTALTIDGAPPQIKDAQGRIYLAPGLHRLEASMASAEAEVIELELGAGQVVAWPRQGRRRLDSPVATDRVQTVIPPPAAPAHLLPRPVPPSEPSWRRRTAFSLGVLGGALELAGVGTYLLTRSRADTLADSDPYQAGFLSTEKRYQRAANTVAPFALVGGLLCAQAIALGPRSVRWGNTAWAVSALGTGAALLTVGGVLTFRRHDHLGESSVDAPDLQAASVAAGLALPLITYGLSYFLTRRSPQLRAYGSPVGGVSW